MKTLHRLGVLLVMLTNFSSAGATSKLDRSDFWLGQCTQKDDAMCLSYVKGLKDGYLNGYLRSRGLAIQLKETYIKKTAEAILSEQVGCPDTQAIITVGQSVKIWIKFLKDNPETHHEEPTDTLSAAMKKAFPCTVEKIERLAKERDELYKTAK